MSAAKKKKRKINYKKKLWDIFSKVIRMCDADDNGMVKCISCDKVDHWKTMDCGHYLPKSLGLSIYFEETNCAPQCSGCNRWRHGNQPKYALALIKRYGDDILEELDKKQKNFRQIKSWEYEELIEKYQKELTNLQARQPLSIIFGAR